MTPVARAVSDALFRHQLEGFRGYPRNADARFLEVFNESVVSVKHARAVLDSFTTTMPTLQDIRDVSWNIRPRFEDQEPERERWEREYGKPDPNWSRNLTGAYSQQKLKMQWQVIRDTLYYTEGPGRSTIERMEPEQREVDRKFWQRQALRIRADHAEALAAFRRDDLPMGWEELMKADWVREVYVPPVIETEPRRRQITEQDFKALASGDAEDRWE